MDVEDDQALRDLASEVNGLLYFPLAASLWRKRGIVGEHEHETGGNISLIWEDGEPTRARTQKYATQDIENKVFRDYPGKESKCVSCTLTQIPYLR